MEMDQLCTGISRTIRAKMHSRQGPGILQDYRDIFKLFKRQSVAPEQSGVLVTLAPLPQRRMAFCPFQ